MGTNRFRLGSFRLTIDRTVGCSGHVAIATFPRSCLLLLVGAASSPRLLLTVIGIVGVDRRRALEYGLCRLVAVDAAAGVPVSLVVFARIGPVKLAVVAHPLGLVLASWFFRHWPAGGGSDHAGFIGIGALCVGIVGAHWI